MRNIFDQYTQPENRLTHALASSLAAEPLLLRKFVKWVTGERILNGRKLEILEQRLPGEEEEARDPPGIGRARLACFLKWDYRLRSGFARCFAGCNSLPNTLVAQSGIVCAVLLNLPLLKFATTRKPRR
jgi:hypothetical protein